MPYANLKACLANAQNCFDAQEIWQRVLRSSFAKMVSRTFAGRVVLADDSVAAKFKCLVVGKPSASGQTGIETFATSAGAGPAFKAIIKLKATLHQS